MTKPCRFLDSLTMLRRLVHPEDAAAAVLFLTSDSAVNITGQALDVNAGLAQMRE
jgi:NAD(P)-dependent dehydrogenase (short-subunit alcohol dehydrogenase family)